MPQGTWTLSTDRRGELNDDVGSEFVGRARAFDGDAYAVTSQAATDALTPFTAGGTLLADNEGQPLALISPRGNVGIDIEVIAGDTVVVGDLLRPQYSADATEVDRYVSVAEAALPTAAGTYWTTHVAITAGSANDTVKAIVFPIRHVVEES